MLRSGRNKRLKIFENKTKEIIFSTSRISTSPRHKVYSVPLPREGFSGLSPAKEAPSPPNWNMKHYKLVEFLSNLNAKPPLHERKAPSPKRKAPLLTTFWRRFWVYFLLGNEIKSCLVHCLYKRNGIFPLHLTLCPDLWLIILIQTSHLLLFE